MKLPFPDEKATQNRIGKEKEFHDRRFESDVDFVKERTSAFYAIARRSFSAYKEHVFSLLEHKPVRILEYGCGDGSLAFELALKGSDVIGIDISESAVEKARKRSAHLTDNEDTLVFEVMNAEVLTFEENSFDAVCGSAILHHLDIEKAYQQIARVLRPGGVAVFLEPLGHNPLINFYRHLTPELRTRDEHPLLLGDIKLAQRYFSLVQAEYFQLLTLMAVPFTRSVVFLRMLSLLEAAETRLFKAMPLAGLFAWSVILKCRKNAY